MIEPRQQRASFLRRHSACILERVKSVHVAGPISAEEILPAQLRVKQHQVTASLFGHAGQGQIHLRPFLDPANPEDVARMTPLATDLYREVLEVGGTISGEHGDGLSRTQFIRMQYGPLADVFAEVKRIFDPGNLLMLGSPGTGN